MPCTWTPESRVRFDRGLVISPELESKLRERATAEGIPVDVYLERLLQDEDAEIAHTEALLQAAADSGDPIELTEEEWGRIEREAFADVESRSRQRA